MNNLTTRQKAGMYVFILAIIIIAGIIFGIKGNNTKYKEYQAQLDTLNQQVAYLDQLMAQNDTTTQEISTLDEQISDIELSFIDSLDTECIEQYVMKTMEDAGSPYLSSISAEDIDCPAITYADGTTSPDSLQCLRIKVIYSSTDGYNVTQYNTNPDMTATAETDPMDTLHQQMSLIGSEEYSTRVGYDEFLAALNTISKANPTCIKISSVSTEDTAGFLTMSASIDFYGTYLTNRVSTDDSTAAYTSWKGDTNVNTDSGFIGFPYIVTDPNSPWFHVKNADPDCVAYIDRPFTPYWANALYSKTVSGPDGLDAITGVTSAYTAGGIATPTPAATDDGTTTTDGATDLTDTTETSETTAAE
ncbi:MAG: DUF3450 domain-containing protein [Saccharofermentans sp.]|jgi:cell division protein FtsB|nr:DUF3450 domain-containing protein [Mageeibacillus sp.]MCI1263949.1 DUF3450 domain-containing protein [Saccharofermentans sp.]MCI1275610.1 DUF3450 domain-containing protein [Saccharofermentans sp.]MCI1768891.1 DUF3450 domain-containing protein [Mageeibacillus sp.]MCI2044647.1 DUF3450 domain-containing protein [Mageeibacillus sp.]